MPIALLALAESAAERTQRPHAALPEPVEQAEALDDEVRFEDTDEAIEVVADELDKVPDGLLDPRDPRGDLLGDVLSRADEGLDDCLSDADCHAPHGRSQLRKLEASRLRHDVEGLQCLAGGLRHLTEGLPEIPEARLARERKDDVRGLDRAEEGHEVPGVPTRRRGKLGQEVLEALGLERRLAEVEPELFGALRGLLGGLQHRGQGLAKAGRHFGRPDALFRYRCDGGRDIAIGYVYCRSSWYHITKCAC